MFRGGRKDLASCTAREMRRTDRSSVSLFLVYNDMFFFLYSILCRCKTLREEVFVATYQYIKCYFAVVKIVRLATRERFDTQTDLR